MNGISVLIRRITLIILIFVFLFLCIVRLISMQIVEGEEYLAQTEKSYTAVQEMIATRGQIFDSEGLLMTGNRAVYRIIVQKAFLPASTQNDVLLGAVNVLRDCGEKWNDTVPISYTEPFEFTEDNADKLRAFKAFIIVNPAATVDNCISALAKKYRIDTEKFTPEQVRLIGGVRYEMEKRDFSYDNRFTLADDVSVGTVIKLKELSIKLPGIDAAEESARDYIVTGAAPHVLGSVGAISAEEYASLKPDGYSYNDIIGKYGVEDAMESVLRGTNGERTIIRDSKGVAVSDTVTKEVIAGNSVKLTINSKEQLVLQEILANHINWLRNTADRGNDCDAGAVVVLNAKTGAVLGMATYPTYDLKQSVEDYASVIALPGSPMLNRCTYGLYRPGSAFKTITAADGLINGLIDINTRGICTGKYTFYADYQPKCTGYHYGYNVVNCLKWSCNIFFYDLGRRLGIEELSSFAARFGYGTSLGLEIGGYSGQMSSPELYEKLHGEKWDDGNTLQAAIGQLDTMITPLHLAVQALTLANDGVRYKPYVVDSVWDYDMNEMLYKTEPSVAEVIEDKNDAFSIVRQGMIAVSTLVNWPTSSALWNFEGLPYGVAIKTGTPEAGADGTYNSTVMGYYPAEDPQIAFGVVLENGEYSRYMVRNIIDCYIYHDYQPDIDENGIVLTPWKRR
ncbi:MAG: hypothetical protein K5876_00025 [Ruminiclostridium sp.]|nr:hypothetical protein [Ruminiclostridium sp.]